jgi:hypothetical protein
MSVPNERDAGAIGYRHAPIAIARDCFFLENLECNAVPPESMGDGQTGQSSSDNDDFDLTDSSHRVRCLNVSSRER